MHFILHISPKFFQHKPRELESFVLALVVELFLPVQGPCAPPTAMVQCQGCWSPSTKEVQYCQWLWHANTKHLRLRSKIQFDFAVSSPIHCSFATRPGNYHIVLGLGRPCLKQWSAALGQATRNGCPKGRNVTVQVTNACKTNCDSGIVQQLWRHATNAGAYHETLRHHALLHY